METTAKIVFTAALVMVALLFTSVVRAAETTLVIDLQRKIKSDFKKMEDVNRDQGARADKINNEIKQIVTDLTNTSDEAKKEEIRNLYFKKRAEHLHAEATRVVEIEEALGSVVKNMVTLEKEIEKTGGDGKELLSSNPEPIKETLRGTANIVTTIQAIRGDDPKVRNLALTLKNLDMQYRSFFTHGRRASLAEQIAYLEDLHAYVYSVRGLLRHETAYLKSNVYFLMKDGVVRVINDFQKQFYATTFKGFEDQHRQDAEVLGDGSTIETEGYQGKVDLDDIGNW